MLDELRGALTLDEREELDEKELPLPRLDDEELNPPPPRLDDDELNPPPPPREPPPPPRCAYTGEVQRAAASIIIAINLLVFIRLLFILGYCLSFFLNAKVLRHLQVKPFIFFLFPEKFGIFRESCYFCNIM